MLKIYKIRKDTMTRLFWRLHCKQQTQSTPCVSGFNANLENETAVSVYLDTYIHRSSGTCRWQWRHVNGDNDMQFQCPCDQTQTNISDIPRTGKHITIRNILKKTIGFMLIMLKLQWNYSCNLFSILLNNGTFRYIKLNFYYKYIHLNWQKHTFYEKRILWNKGVS